MASSTSLVCHGIMPVKFLLLKHLKQSHFQSRARWRDTNTRRHSRKIQSRTQNRQAFNQWTTTIRKRRTSECRSYHTMRMCRKDFDKPCARQWFLNSNFDWAIRFAFVCRVTLDVKHGALKHFIWLNMSRQRLWSLTFAFTRLYFTQSS